MLMKAVTVDAQAVQRHRATILECLKVLIEQSFFLFLIMERLSFVLQCEKLVT